MQERDAWGPQCYGISQDNCKQFLFLSFPNVSSFDFDLRLSFTCGAAFGIQLKRELHPNPGRKMSSKDSCRLVHCFLHSLLKHCKLQLLFQEFFYLLLFGGPQKEEEQGQEAQRAPGAKASAEVSTAASCHSFKCCSCHGSSCLSLSHASSWSHPGPYLEDVS